MIDRCQDRAANQDLAAGIAFPFGLTCARQESILLGAQTGQAFIERLNSLANFSAFDIDHLPVRLVMQREVPAAVERCAARTKHACSRGGDRA